MKPVSNIFLGLFCSFCLLIQAETSLVYGDIGKVDKINPLIYANSVEYRVSQLMFDSLIKEPSQGEYVFSIAKEIDISPDGLSYTFLLRENVFWSDGTALTAKDIEFTLRVITNKRTQSSFTVLKKYIEDVSFIHPLALTITLSRPFYRPLSLFTFHILPRHKFTTTFLNDNTDFGLAPVGSGPFKYVKGLKTEKIILERNRFFSHRRRPTIKKIIVYLYKDRSSAVASFQREQPHIIMGLFPGDINPISKAHNDFVVDNSKSPAIQLIQFNYHSENRYKDLFYNLQFRKSLIHCLNRQKIFEDAYLGDALKNSPMKSQDLLTGPFLTDSWAYNREIKPLSFDLGFAKELQEVLKQQGFTKEQDYWQKNGQELTFCLGYNKVHYEICKSLKSFFSQLGIKIVLQAETSQCDLRYTEFSFTNELDVVSLFREYDSESFAVYKNAEIIELLYQLQNTLNPWSMRSICHKIHNITNEESMFIFLWQSENYSIQTKKLRCVDTKFSKFFYFPEYWKLDNEM